MATGMSPVSSGVEDNALRVFMAEFWSFGGPLSPLPALGVDGTHSQCYDTETTSSDAAETVAPAPSRRSKKWQRRPDRNRPYREIPKLKAQLAELQRQLQAQKSQASNRALQALESHVANVKLKTALDKNLQRAKTFRRVLDQQLKEIRRVLPSSGPVTLRTLAYDAAQDDAIFKTLETKVDELFEDMGKVLQRSGLDWTTSYLRDAYMCSPEDADVDTLASRSCVSSPFKTNVLDRAVWEILQEDETALLEPSQPVRELVRVAVDYRWIEPVVCP